MTTAPQIRARTTPDGLLLLNVDSGSIMSANRVGARIWELIEQGMSPDQITMAVAREYNAPEGQVSVDVREFVDQLRSHAAIVDVAS